MKERATMTAAEVAEKLRSARHPRTPGAVLAYRSLCLRAAELLEDDGPKPGEVHPVDKAFHDLAVKERDYERVKVDRLVRELAYVRSILKVAEQSPTNQVAEAAGKGEQ